MSDQDSKKEKAKKNVDNLKEKVNKAELQIDLNQEEAKDKYEEEKSEFCKIVDETIEKFGKLKDTGREKAKDLKTKLEELRVQLALGKADGKDEFKRQKENIDDKLDSFVHLCKEKKDIADDKVDELSEDFKVKSKQFRTQLDLFRVQLAIGKADAGDYVEEKKKDLKIQIHELKQKLEKVKDIADDKLEDFSEEVGEKFEKIGNAAKKLFGWN